MAHTDTERTLAAGLLGLAGMISDYFADCYRHPDGSVSEPDESDPACHLWNCAEALREDPRDVQTWLYAEHEPCDGHDHERAVIAAGRELAEVLEPPPAGQASTELVGPGSPARLQRREPTTPPPTVAERAALERLLAGDAPEVER